MVTNTTCWVGTSCLSRCRGCGRQHRVTIRSWDEVVRHNLGYQGNFKCSDTLKGIAHNVGLERNLISIDEPLIVKNDSGLTLKVCYCLVYDDCWVSTSYSIHDSVPNCFKVQSPIKC